MSREQEQCLRTKLGMLKGFDIMTVFLRCLFSKENYAKVTERFTS